MKKKFGMVALLLVALLACGLLGGCGEKGESVGDPGGDGWKAALKAENFVNVTVKMTMSMGGMTQTAEYRVDNGKIHAISEGGPVAEAGVDSYMEKVGETWYEYRKEGDKWNKSEAMYGPEESFLGIVGKLRNTGACFVENEGKYSVPADKVAEFADLTDMYVSGEFDIEVMFSKGRLTSVTTTVTQSGQTITSTEEFSKYGKTSVTLPTVE